MSSRTSAAVRRRFGANSSPVFGPRVGSSRLHVFLSVSAKINCYRVYAVGLGRPDRCDKKRSVDFLEPVPLVCLNKITIDDTISAY